MGISLVVIYSVVGLDIEVISHVVLASILVIGIVLEYKKESINEVMLLGGLLATMVIKMVTEKEKMMSYIITNIIIIVLFKTMEKVGKCKTDTRYIKLFIIISLVVGEKSVYMVLLLTLIVELIYNMILKNKEKQYDIGIVKGVWVSLMVIYLLKVVM